MKAPQNKACGVVLLPVLITLFLNSCCSTKKEYYSNYEEKEERLKYIYQINTINGKRCGKFVWLAETGDTIEISYFKKGKLNGISKSFFENGRIQIEVECFNDIFHGTLREYYENGQLRCELLYNLDRLWEIKAVYDSSGNVLNPGNLKEGNGLVKIFYPDGQVQYKGAFEDGVRSGY
ncbi:MAG: hypothetical protein WD077_02365 [Bacteroidia bacterium]